MWSQPWRTDRGILPGTLLLPLHRLLLLLGKLTNDSNKVLDLRHDSLHLLSRHCSDQAGRLKTRAPLPCKHAHVFLLEPNIHQSHPWRREMGSHSHVCPYSFLSAPKNPTATCVSLPWDGALPYMARASSYLIPSSSYLTVVGLCSFRSFLIAFPCSWVCSLRSFLRLCVAEHS